MLSVFNNAQGQKWDEIIKTFPDYDVYYLPQYSGAFELHGDGEPLLFYFEHQGMRAANVVMRRDIAADRRFDGKFDRQTYYDLATPYGYGGWLFDGEQSAESIKLLNSNYQEYCRDESIISEFMRLHPLIGSETACVNMYEIVTHGPFICMDLSDPETIWNSLYDNKRRNIRKAIREGVTIHHGMDEKLMQQFQAIYNGSMKTIKTQQYYLFEDVFYKSILNGLIDNAIIFYAMKDNEMIGASIFIMAGKRMNYFLSANNFEYKSCQANSQLIYSAALWGCKNGFRNLLLGGGLGLAEDSLYAYKKGFNRHSDCVFKSGRKIFDEQIYRKLCDYLFRSRDFRANSLFFPEYRM